MPLVKPIKPIRIAAKGVRSSNVNRKPKKKNPHKKKGGCPYCG